MSYHDWSRTEKKIARAAFDEALDAALADVMSEFKAKAAAVTEPSALWELEDYLRERRQNIDETFDYRYSQLIDVFARLILEGRLEEARLDGLADEKRKDIRRIVEFVREHNS